MPHLIDDRTLARIFRSLEAYPSILLAVSGGPDSMALMCLTRRWLASRSGQRPAVQVATVDHRLRPESTAEAEFVARQAEKLGFSHATLAWDGPKPRSGLQAAARKARYELLTAYCIANGIPALATAHTEDDQAETFLMRLRRGSGLDGLAAMPEAAAWNGVAVLRPLLAMSKARLVGYLHARAIPYLKDPSNADPAFERARIRRAANALRAAGLRMKPLAMSASRLARSRAALDTLSEEVLLRHLRIGPFGQGSFDRDALTDLPADLQLRVLARALTLIGGRAEPPRLAKLENRLADLLSDRCRTVLAGCRVVAATDRLDLCRELGRMPTRTTIPQFGVEFLWDGRFLLRCDDERQDVQVAPLGKAGWNSLAVRSRDDPRLAAALASARRNLPAALATPALWCGGAVISAPLVASDAAVGYTNRQLFHARLTPAFTRFLTPA